MERSFGSHKSPKTRKKNGKERNVPFKERKRTERTQRKRTRHSSMCKMYAVEKFKNPRGCFKTYQNLLYKKMQTSEKTHSSTDRVFFFLRENILAN